VNLQIFFHSRHIQNILDGKSFALPSNSSNWYFRWSALLFHELLHFALQTLLKTNNLHQFHFKNNLFRSSRNTAREIFLWVEINKPLKNLSFLEICTDVVFKSSFQYLFFCKIWFCSTDHLWFYDLSFRNWLERRIASRMVSSLLIQMWQSTTLLDLVSDFNVDWCYVRSFCWFHFFIHWGNTFDYHYHLRS